MDTDLAREAACWVRVSPSRARRACSISLRGPGSPPRTSTRQVVQRALPPHLCMMSIPASSMARTSFLPGSTSNDFSPSTVTVGMILELPWGASNPRAVLSLAELAGPVIGLGDATLGTQPRRSPWHSKYAGEVGVARRRALLLAGLSLSAAVAKAGAGDASRAEKQAYEFREKNPFFRSALRNGEIRRTLTAAQVQSRTSVEAIGLAGCQFFSIEVTVQSPLLAPILQERA